MRMPADQILEDTYGRETARVHDDGVRVAYMSTEDRGNEWKGGDQE